MAETLVPHPVDTIPQTTQDFAGIGRILYDTVIQLHATRVLETGTDVGDSARLLSLALVQTGGRLWTVDTVPPKGEWFTNWTHKNIEWVQADSKTLSLQGELDLLFLDSDHTQTHVTAELNQLGTKVRKGGRIALHDTLHGEYGQGILQATHVWATMMGYAWTEYPIGRGLAIIAVE